MRSAFVISDCSSRRLCRRAITRSVAAVAFSSSRSRTPDRKRASLLRSAACKSDGRPLARAGAAGDAVSGALGAERCPGRTAGPRELPSSVARPPASFTLAAELISAGPPPPAPSRSAGSPARAPSASPSDSASRGPAGASAAGSAPAARSSAGGGGLFFSSSSSASSSCPAPSRNPPPAPGDGPGAGPSCPRSGSLSSSSDSPTGTARKRIGSRGSGGFVRASSTMAWNRSCWRTRLAASSSRIRCRSARSASTPPWAHARAQRLSASNAGWSSSDTSVACIAARKTFR